MGLGEGVRWWMGEGEGGPGWGDRAPEGPSVFKTWWLLLINLVVTSNSRILAKGWGSPTAKLMQQNLETEKEENLGKWYGKGREKMREKRENERERREKKGKKVINLC